MAVYDIKVTGYETIQADSEEEALEAFERMMAAGYKVSDLRWKVVDADSVDWREE